ncbi:uncharacterized protein K460DRAFT_346241 [Cucurbitaria berberidis CBS 394.84]|uniref:Pentatricopeptide repeat protein n=1 Tax=Cucurbitaria berberidis CBS 394.84 TaxID=1168544 RepID=A0A9P4GB81_9PLEO|nr:uncharacterized protein K460DRAFT_346241 [Cucurbitaria berberidis CBS 394.84]KAF1842417.1 hypothetical protein K460DRAFT_346241 [Cucurbitaria berberidis CBS 394.84]
MLNCRACLWRCLQALDVPSTNAHRLRRNVNPLLEQGQRRLLSTVVRTVDTKPVYRNKVEQLSKHREEPWQKSAVAANQKKRERAVLRQRPAPGVAETPNLSRLSKRDPSLSVSEWERRKKELRYLQDPVELAGFVRKELGKDKVTEMVQLVRMASQSMQCVVSWNHIIDHYLAKERVNDALKVYNEMKKRAQFPDSYTYTILLRGLSINAHTSGVLSKALSVYHSLYAPNSRVEPSIIHTNAALRVCARALDMDALWGVAGKIPETGRGAANEVTYITIINAMRQSLLINAPKGETEEEAAARKERGIMEGRRMWEGIVNRWRNADMIIDEELVCAMGRLLLIGSRPRDWDDVLSLVEQTMDIPRLLPRLGSPGRQEAPLPHLRASYVSKQQRFDDDHLAPGKPPKRGDEFLALTPQGVGSAVSNPLSYAQPGNNTLSVVQEACQKIAASKAAREYWDLLTDPTTYNITPDLNNLHMRLRNLRQNRASAAAVKLLQEDLVGKGFEPRPGTFRIAMSTCVRDKNNHNSLKHASQILNLMSKTLEDVDAKAVSMFAELAGAFPLAKASDLIDALTVLRPIAQNIRLQLGVGGQQKYGNGVGAVYLKGEAREDAIIALRKIHGVYDRLLFSNLVAEEQKPPFKKERAILSSFIQRIMYKSGRKWEGAKDAQDKGMASEEVDLHGYLNDEAEGDVVKAARGKSGNGPWRKYWETPGDVRA